MGVGQSLPLKAVCGFWVTGACSSSPVLLPSQSLGKDFPQKPLESSTVHRQSSTDLAASERVEAH